MILSKAETGKCDTWDRTLDDCGDTCVTTLITLCMSVISIHMPRKTCIHKDQPSWSPKQFTNMT